MNSILASVFIVAFGQDATDAVRFLESVEAKATKARTLKFSSSVSASMAGRTFTFSAQGAFKAGGRLKAGFEGDVMGRKVRVALLSDGTKMDVESEKTSTIDTPKEIDGSLRVLMLRMGTAAALMFAADGKRELKDATTVSDVAFAADEKIGEVTARVVTFTLTVAGGERRSCRLWIDPSTLAPLKHHLHIDKIQDFTETFTEWKVDDEIKDEVFERPARKK